MIALPDGEGGLLLPIDRVIEVPAPGKGCTNCNQAGVVGSADKNKPCPKCSTGTVKRRLRGWVEVEIENNVTGFGEFISYKYHGSSKIHSSAPGALLQIAIETERRWIAGTLPDEIAANLELEDVE